MEKVVLEKEAWRPRCHLVSPSLCIIYSMEGEFEQIITKLRLSVKDNNN